MSPIDRFERALTAAERRVLKGLSSPARIQD